MTIHFICTGNIYRIRLAEAYCASKGVSGLSVSSSGIGTKLNRGIPIAPYAVRVLRERGIERFAAPSFQQTTPALVQASDVLVFMEREHYSFCKEWLDPARQTVEIWDIPDVGQAETAGIMTEVEQIFEMIERRTEMLLDGTRTQGVITASSAYSFNGQARHFSGRRICSSARST
jgi:protein-tyrosine-phosphatase